jgi:4-amino-4-deoxy-L-arabinose transferase-like glycosyltransferase
MAKDFSAKTERHPLIALVVLCLIAWLPGFFTLPPLDRDESRFAQATKQMLETGDFVDINLGSGVRYEKPVGIYWLQAASTTALGEGVRDRIWTYRVPSVLGALTAVIATYLLARSVAGMEAAFAAAALLGLSVLLMTEAKIAKTDAVLLACTVTAQAVLMRAYLSARRPDEHPPPSLPLALAGWAAFGLGVLVKGPIIALICGLSATAISLWDRDGRWLRRLRALPGLAVAILLVAPWAIAIGIASHGQFYQQSLGQDFAVKAMGDAEAHGAPPGYFAALAHLTFWPGSLWLLPAVVLAVKRHREPAVRYLIVWAATTWLLFELVPTKLPHYVLPAYPALAMLCGLWLASDRSAETKGERVARMASLALFVLVGLALAGFLAFAPARLGNGSPWWLYASAAVGAFAIIAVIPLAQDKESAGAMAALAAVVLYGVAGFGTVPNLQRLWLSPRLAEAVKRHTAAGDPPVVTAGYAEPSIRFLLGTRTALYLGPEAGATTTAAGGLVLVNENERDGFLKAVEDGGAHAHALEDVDGLNYSNGRGVRITLYRVVPAPR